MEMLWCARCRLWMEKVRGGCRWCGWHRHRASERYAPTFLLALLRRVPAMPDRSETRAGG
jgi:hypothetical protein